MSAQLSMAGATNKKQRDTAQQVPVTSRLLTAANMSRDPPWIRLAVNHRDFGLDYDEETALLMLRTEATIARNAAETPEEHN
jgi:hypothetical protein